jgi:hypothetical protein
VGRVLGFERSEVHIHNPPLLRYGYDLAIPEGSIGGLPRWAKHKHKSKQSAFVVVQSFHDSLIRPWSIYPSNFFACVVEMRRMGDPFTFQKSGHRKEISRTTSGWPICPHMAAVKAFTGMMVCHMSQLAVDRPN